MSNTQLLVRNHQWPVGDHEHLSHAELTLLDFMRIESRPDISRETRGLYQGHGLVEVDAELLVAWKVVRGWGVADYIAAIAKLETVGAIILDADIFVADANHLFGLPVTRDDAQVEALA